MAIRITIMIDEDLQKKLRMMQARQIQKTKKGVTFSYVLNYYLRKGLRNEK